MYKNFVFLLGVTTNNNNSAEKACFLQKIIRIIRTNLLFLFR